MRWLRQIGRVSLLVTVHCFLYSYHVCDVSQMDRLLRFANKRDHPPNNMIILKVSK
jgi:hypothetical protein